MAKKEKWQRMLGEFEVLEQGKGLINRWAAVSPASDAAGRNAHLQVA